MDEQEFDDMGCLEHERQNFGDIEFAPDTSFETDPTFPHDSDYDEISDDNWAAGTLDVNT